ncbi:MAG: A/G-specific adenine glycosylase [Saprospiraceae bacterium]|nr:A/G-specific adenine glycosylase [Saprospiraceae bacterium]
MKRLKKFGDRLLEWYKQNQRSLPWNESSDPYEIWVSEIILQQTQVTQALPYYKRFLKTFPDIRTLAEADQDEVLKSWEGLGYYSRARNLHKGARYVQENYEGRLPRSRQELLTIPGIGPYTSSAIAAFAFGQSEAVVDGNVLRVMSRYLALTHDISKATTRLEIERLSKTALRGHDPADYNRAIMDLGATICRPRQPLCEECPVNEYCEARANDLIDVLPFNSKKIVRQQRYLHYFIITENNELVVEKRRNEGIWKGLYQLPLIETTSKLEEPELGQLSMGSTGPFRPLHGLKHQLTHQTLHIEFYGPSEDGQFKIESDAIARAIEKYAFPVPIRRTLQRLI